MVEILAPLSDEEAAAQAVLLASTPVAGLSPLILSGTFRVFHGNVQSPEHLGKLRTEFGAIGPVNPDNDKFLVRELIPKLRAHPEVPDGGLLERIEKLREPLRAGAVPLNVSVLKLGDAYYIKDGNKRSIASYENMIEAGDYAIAFRVYVLIPAIV